MLDVKICLERKDGSFEEFQNIFSAMSSGVRDQGGTQGGPNIFLKI